MTRTGRKSIAWICLGSLLSLQLMVSAYACPMPSDGMPAFAASSANAAPPCSGMDQERPLLCEQHCVQGSQSVDTQAHSVAHAPVLAAITIPMFTDPHLAARHATVEARLVAVVDPPPLIRFGVLRL